MSYNHNFYNNQHVNEFTFQSRYRPPFIPPPPPPPPMFYVPTVPVVAHAPNTNISDQEFVKQFENINAESHKGRKPKTMTISQVQDKLRNLLMELSKIKKQEKELSEKINSCSDEEWQVMLNKISNKKGIINECLLEINDSHLNELKLLIAKRAAKRLRLKRLRAEKKKEKDERIKQLKENSRKIDENLQKIKDSINQAKQEEEMKVQADMVLKEVLRKKHDARKFINKFDALKKLRKARENTAKGRGENVSNKEIEEFETKINNLRALWVQKLSDYEKEEVDLRKKLEESVEDQNKEANEIEKQVASNLSQWREVLFGDANALPQFDFKGDLDRFIEVRTKWDQYISSEGTPIPIGWVVPNKPT